MFKKGVRKTRVLTLTLVSLPVAPLVHEALEFLAILGVAEIFQIVRELAFSGGEPFVLFLEPASSVARHSSKARFPVEPEAKPCQLFAAKPQRPEAQFARLPHFSRPKETMSPGYPDFLCQNFQPRTASPIGQNTIKPKTIARISTSFQGSPGAHPRHRAPADWCVEHG
jgi:hypothetical protein